MKITEVIEYLENLIEKSDKKSEINFYQRFIQILKSLQNLDLPKDKINLIENKLEELDLQSIQEKQLRYLKKNEKLYNFEIVIKKNKNGNMIFIKK